ncbi:MAG: right-handed parallel beta-helix repeat-containing protein [Candidatus Brocadiaceae bacterium]
MRNLTTIFCALLFSFVAGIASAATLNVPGDYSTIQAAVDAAALGDLILVADGTYKENVDLMGKWITLRSVNGAEKTIIDGQKKGTVLRIVNSSLTRPLIEGFTIQNGLSPDGAGIYAQGTGVNPNIRKCRITGNATTPDSEGLGGGIYMLGTNARIEECEIFGNVARIGGGVYMYSVHINVLYRNYIHDNIATIGAGGVSVNGDYGPSIELCTIVRNKGALGGGIGVDGAPDTDIYGTVIAHNRASLGGGVYANWGASFTLASCTIARNTVTARGGGVYAVDNGTHIHVRGSILWANRKAQTGKNDPVVFEDGATVSVDDTDIQGGWPTGTGNISKNPGFVDMADDNYHLNVHSKVIDRLDDGPYKDIDGQCRPQDGDHNGVARYDMGADEYDVRGCRPEKPYNLQVTDVTPTSITFTWQGGESDPIPLEAFEVFHKTGSCTSNVRWRAVDKDVGDWEYTMEQLKPNTYHAFRVRGRNEFDVSKFSSCMSAKTAP